VHLMNFISAVFKPLISLCFNVQWFQNVVHNSQNL
jgi:hypothetical protein